MIYRGRFAPSPTGPLHFGSLVAAVGSYLQAKSMGGQWLIRIEDLDTPRCVAGAADAILHALESLGFEWDDSVLYQSTRSAAYAAALEQLRSLNLCYPCSCSRSELLAADPASDGEEIRYPGWCRNGPRKDQGEYAWRFRVPVHPVQFHDVIHGALHVDLSESIGDFVIKRRDGLFAYQLAVVVDDAAQGITEVVRGVDLLLNTPRQIVLQQALNLPTPGYVHLPLVKDAQGRKLSKSDSAPDVSFHLSGQAASQLLWHALDFLRQSPPLELKDAALPDIWKWSIRNWQLQTLIYSRNTWA
ncbi:MAG TPA: tRNA glutamyl-Q(34) synthetase GluQRS [Steroidobacteraceae bacterium]|nr:tRNA glutamyl-Q(34) synthetase GluQRS [Steroidobacteraceae bacterium]